VKKGKREWRRLEGKRPTNKRGTNLYSLKKGDGGCEGKE